MTKKKQVGGAKKWSVPFSFRVGHGYDIHRLVPGDGLALAGVRIACEFGTDAHSDGDVAIHALCDALLGAAGLPDIGHWFPPADPAFKGADSRVLLREVLAKLVHKRWVVVNVDLTLVAEAPRVGPHVALMKQRLAADLGVARDAIGIKATTNEQMDAVGSRAAIAAHAVALLARR